MPKTTNIKKILVPTDFSKNALNAAEYAFAYAEKTKSKIILFNSYEDPSGELIVPNIDEHTGSEEAKQEAEQRMKKLIASLSKTFPNTEPEGVVLPGIVSENITEYVKKNNITLVIMGTTGQGAIARVFMGSTTSDVIADVPCTIIAVPPKAKFKEIKNIAIATDLDKDSFSAVKESVLFAKMHHAKIIFVHVQDLKIFYADLVLQKMVDRIKEEMDYKKISSYICRDSNVADGLSFFIKKYKPDLLSMVTHGRKFPETIWETSWTNKMSNNTVIPLLVLHTSKYKKALEMTTEMDDYSMEFLE